MTEIIRGIYFTSVAAVVAHEDRVLITRRRDTGEWQIPGGILEPHEPLADGMRREVFEETGLVVEPERLTGVYQNIADNRISFVFRARFVCGLAAPTDEVAEVLWCTPAVAADHMSAVFAVRVADAFTHEPPLIRVHDGVRLH